MKTDRLADLDSFYSIIDRLEEKVGGHRTLSECSGRMTWPRRGIYFFFESGEARSHPVGDLRVVRVGTHALTAGSRTTLWNRLSQHRGSRNSGGGHHRGSIFRLIVGTALVNRQGYDFPTWGKGSTASRDVREQEIELEKEVSGVIGAMPFLWLAIEDEPAPAPGSLRGYVERNSIALLSNFQKPDHDPSSNDWLGHFCDRERIRLSGLWNSNHVDETYDPKFLVYFEKLVSNMEIDG